MHVSVTTSVSEPPARYSITTKSSSPTRKLDKKGKRGKMAPNCTRLACPRREESARRSHLSTKLTMLGFFSSFITRISLMMSSFFGCFCKLICLMATCDKPQDALSALTHVTSTAVTSREERLSPPAPWRRLWQCKLCPTLWKR